jgi:hypothetical protein
VSKSKIKCDNVSCNKYFYKENKEINRSKRLGRKQYCCMQCYAYAEGKDNLNFADPKKVALTRKNISKYCGNKRDEHTPFRFYIHNIKNSRRKKEHNIDEFYLKEIWDKQNGICPYTGWKLILPHSTAGWKDKTTIMAVSLDRINNDLGHLKNNV